MNWHYYVILHWNLEQQCHRWMFCASAFFMYLFKKAQSQSTRMQHRGEGLNNLGQTEVQKRCSKLKIWQFSIIDKSKTFFEKNIQQQKSLFIAALMTSCSFILAFIFLSFIQVKRQQWRITCVILWFYNRPRQCSLYPLGMDESDGIISSSSYQSQFGWW